MFKSNTNLRALYLPSSLTTIGGNKDDHCAFAYASNMYFVNEPYDIDDYFVDGEFNKDYYLANLPEEPEVYYFPNSLTTIHQSTQTFRGCTGLNSVLVFGKGVTTLGCGGFFMFAGSSSKVKNVVFLGDIDTFATGNGRSNVNFYFANKNDTNFTSIGISGGNNSSNGNSYIYFCANGDCYTYALTVTDRASQTKLEASPLDHMYLKEVNTKATCTEPGVVGLACFCGAGDPENSVTVPANGHEKTTFVAITYNGANKFFESGDVTYGCGVCKEEHIVNDDAAIIFVAKGYTYTESDNPSKAIMQSFAVNGEALNLYNQYTTNTIEGYGLVAASASTTEVFDNGVAKENSAVASFKDKNYDIMEMKITGIEKNESYAQTALNCCAYILVKNGESVDSYYATEVLDSDLEGIQVSVTETLTGGASYNQIYENRNPQ